MKFKVALSFSVALLCLVATWITGMESVASIAPTFAVFISWAAYAAAGGGKNGVISSLVTNLTGALWGYLSIVVILPVLGFAGNMALPIAIFIIGGGMIAQSLVDILAFIPGTFMGCATFFAILSSSAIGPQGPNAVLIATIGGLILGKVVGFTSDLLTNALAKNDPEADEASV